MTGIKLHIGLSLVVFVFEAAEHVFFNIKPQTMNKVLTKVQVTGAFNQWWQCDLSDIFTDVSEVNIISAVLENGSLYLIYTYTKNDK